MAQRPLRSSLRESTPEYNVDLLSKNNGPIRKKTTPSLKPTNRFSALPSKEDKTRITSSVRNKTTKDNNNKTATSPDNNNNNNNNNNNTSPLLNQSTNELNNNNNPNNTPETNMPNPNTSTQEP